MSPTISCGERVSRRKREEEEERRWNSRNRRGNYDENEAN